MKYIIKRVIIYALLALSVAVISCREEYGLKPGPAAVNGEFRPGTDFLNTDGPVSLRGEWKFRWLEDDPSFANPDYDDSSWPLLETKGYWTGLTGSGTGYGWYRLHIIFDGTVPAAGTKLGLSIPYIKSAYDLYVNGIYAGSSGKFGKSINESVPQVRPELVTIQVPAPGGELVIAARVSNFHHREGGFFETPQLGRFDDLREGLWRKDFINILLIGLIFMMGLYHFLIWLGRREDRASLYFTMGSFVIFFRSMAVNSYFEMLFPQAGLFEFKFKIIYISLAAGVSSFILFFNEIYGWGFNRKALKVTLYVCITLVMLTLLFPCRVYSRISYIYEGLVLFAGMWMTTVTIIAAIKRKRWSAYLLPGCALLFFTGINDLLVIKLVIDTPQVAAAGMGGLMVCQAMVLSARYAWAYKKAEHLSRNLRDEVEIKTGHLLERTKEAEDARREIEKAHAGLVEMENYRNIFFQNITHEFRTPLTIIIGYVERAMESADSCDADALRDQYTVILSNARMLLKLINQLLDISKIESDMMKVREEPVDLVRLVRSIASFFEYPAARRGICFSLDIDAEIIPGMFDCEKLEKIIYNLLSNAFKFTSEKGRITLSLREKSEFVYLSVSDTGAGISEEKLARIFDRFYQGDNSMERVYEGTGIGLSLVREYVDLFNGRVEVLSREGEGSVFTVVLPLKKCGLSVEDQLKPDPDQISRSALVYLSDINPSVKRQKDGLERETGTVDNDTVLIVEDNRDMRLYLKDILKTRYKIKEAGNGVEALSVIAGSMPELIVSDIMMPDMDGYRLLAELKNNASTSRIPVILLTAKVGDEEKIMGLECGADDYIVKPFSSRELLTRVNTLVKLYRYQKMMEERNSIIESELAVAREIQARLVITAASEHHENFYAFYRPYDRVAGDFYGYIEDADKIHIFIADVSGHGVAAAFLSLVARNELAGLIKKGTDAAAVLEQLNNTICSYTVKGNFMTLFYCVFYRETGCLNYARAGHNPPLVFSRKKGSVDELKPSGTALGIYASLGYESGNIYLGEGDRILFYTDGLTECADSSCEMFGTRRLCDILKKSPGLNPEDLSLHIVSQLEEFAGGKSFKDDVTLLVFDVPAISPGTG